MTHNSIPFDEDDTPFDDDFPFDRNDVPITRHRDADHDVVYGGTPNLYEVDDLGGFDIDMAEDYNARRAGLLQDKQLEVKREPKPPLPPWTPDGSSRPGYSGPEYEAQRAAAIARAQRLARERTKAKE